MTDAIVIKDLRHSYRPGNPVLRGLNLTIEEGEFVGLIGLSGAGKSTLLRCVNGLITPTGGSCVVLGESVERMRETERRILRRRIGMIFQEFNLVDRLTVLKNVLIGRLGYLPTISSCLHRFPASDLSLARAALAQVGLTEFESRRVRDLSGGQKQRVAVARAIAQGARIILADEATANLDVLTKDEIMDILQDLVRRTGVTLLCSMHDIALARRYCTRVIGLKDGAVTFDAAPDRLNDAAVADVLARPSHEAPC